MESILARKSGPFLYVEVVIGVLGTISASAAHRLGPVLSGTGGLGEPVGLPSPGKWLANHLLLGHPESLALGN